MLFSSSSADDGSPISKRNVRNTNHDDFSSGSPLSGSYTNLTKTENILNHSNKKTTPRRIRSTNDTTTPLSLSLSSSPTKSLSPSLLRMRHSVDARHHGHLATSGTSSSLFGAMRWILVGVMIGSSTTAVFFSFYCMGGLSVGIMPTEQQAIMPAEQQALATTPATTATIAATNTALHPLNQMHQERVQAKQQQQQQQQLLSAAAAAKADTPPQPKQVTTNKAITEKTTTIQRPPESPFVNLPEPPTLGPNDSFAACLLVKDDNHWLIEWLAYHYFVMPLRHLITVIDPDSKTSPRKILRRWSSRKLLNITIWKDADFMPDKVTAKVEQFNNNTGLMMHRVRQNNMYRSCIPELRRRGLGWLMLTDTDEYVLPSYASGYFRNLTTQVSFQEPGSVLRLLMYEEQVTNIHHRCVYMPRFFYGAKESSSNLVQHGVPPSLDAMGMVTQRFLFREPRRNYNGKNLMHLQRVPNIKKFESVHFVSTEACPDPTSLRNLDLNKHSIVRAHHYLGTPEQYLYRDDPRDSKNDTDSSKGKIYHVRGMERYQDLNQKAHHEDHAAKAWIRGFVKEMGEELAADLLEGVGKLGVE